MTEEIRQIIKDLREGDELEKELIALYESLLGEEETKARSIDIKLNDFKEESERRRRVIREMISRYSHYLSGRQPGQ